MNLQAVSIARLITECLQVIGGSYTLAPRTSGLLQIGPDIPSLPVETIGTARIIHCPEGVEELPVFGTQEQGHPYGVTVSTSVATSVDPRPLADELGHVWAVPLDNPMTQVQIDSYYFAGRAIPTEGDAITAKMGDGTSVTVWVMAVDRLWEVEDFRRVRIRASRWGTDNMSKLTGAGTLTF